MLYASSDNSRESELGRAYLVVNVTDDVTTRLDPGGGAAAGGGADAGAGDARKGPGAGHDGGPAGAGEGRSASFEGKNLGLKSLLRLWKILQV